MDKIFIINIILKFFKKNKYTNMLIELYYKYKEIFNYLFFVESERLKVQKKDAKSKRDKLPLPKEINFNN